LLSEQIGKPPLRCFRKTELIPSDAKSISGQETSLLKNEDTKTVISKSMSVTKNKLFWTAVTQEGFYA
jgi:hypothetical protein